MNSFTPNLFLIYTEPAEEDTGHRDKTKIKKKKKNPKKTPKSYLEPMLVVLSTDRRKHHQSPQRTGNCEKLVTAAAVLTFL